MEPERFNPVLIKDMVQNLQPFYSIEGPCLCSQHLEVVQNVCLDSFQSCSSHFQAFRLNPKCNILGFHQSVISLGQLIFQHCPVLFPDFIEIIILVRNINALFKLFHIYLLVNE